MEVSRSCCVSQLERLTPRETERWLMSTEEQHEPTPDERHTSVLMEVSNTVVRLHKEQLGRGPTAARSQWAGSDTLVCVLEDALTPAERNLVAMGEHQRLRDMRVFLQ